MSDQTTRELLEYLVKNMSMDDVTIDIYERLSTTVSALERDHEAMNYLREQAPNNSILLMTEIATCRYFVLRMTPHPSRVINDPADAILAAKEAAK